MVPVRLFVPSPLCVVKVSLRSWLKIIFLARAVLESLRVQIYTFVYSVFYIVRLPLNGITKHLVGFNYQLEMVFTLLLLFVGHCTFLEVWVVEFRHFVVSELYFFLGGGRSDFQQLVVGFLFLRHVEK